MTSEQIDLATRRLQFLEQSKSLPKETIRDLKSWWREKLRDAGREKIIPFPIGQKNNADRSHRDTIPETHWNCITAARQCQL